MQRAIMEAISSAARQNTDVLQTLKLHIGMGLRSRLDEVYAALDALQNHPLAYDDYLVRQTLSRVIAVSKYQIRGVFPGWPGGGAGEGKRQMILREKSIV